MTSRYDYDALFQHITGDGKRIYGPGFEIPELDRPVVRKLIAYVLHDEVVAQEENIVFHKGVLLTGNVGCGKTSLMHLMRNFSKDSFKPVIKSCQEISIEFSHKGYETITKYTTNAFHPYSCVPRIYCFDDLGLETPVNFWGDKLNVMVRILLSRYDLFISHKMLTHVTTNLNGNELEEIYGNRLRSRMREMFNLISFDPDTTDKRK
ncbi:ATPase [Chitinophaga oryziterrae]|uniref:ATPase n=1 Tax=Chitinophaga oryziterrae TaxID=1031224 RepID=A0A6N8JHK4_9BACT|nr:ATPase [Chitinophaga oryziterrae]MVT44707.1 ATPase [Chitinophaga oryziterrae]